MKVQKAKTQEMEIPKMKAEEEKAQEIKVPETKNGKQEVKFIDVPIDVVGKYRNKNYVDLKGLSFNSEHGHLSFHLGDNHTMVFKENFQKNYLKVVVKEADKIEQSTRRAPQFEKGPAEKSTARMRLLGERDGRVFVGPSGSVKYDGSVRGFIVNLDDKHSLVVDSEILSRELGIKVSPIAMEKNIGIGR